MWKQAKKRERKKLISVTYEKPIQHKIFIKLKIKTAHFYSLIIMVFSTNRELLVKCVQQNVFTTIHSYVQTHEHTKKYQIPVIQ